MDLLQLRYFAMVAQTESFTQAAKVLYISQSSLSQTISRLEKELGYPLFGRKGRSIYLNESGKIFLRGIEAMQMEMENAMRQMNEVNGMQTRELSIYVGCASMCLPGLLEQLREKCGQVTFRILQMGHMGMRTKDGPFRNTDFSIVSQDYYSKEENEVLLLEEDIKLILPNEHKLAKEQKIKCEDLYQEQFIALDNEWSLEMNLEKACENVGFRPNITIRVDNPSVMRILLQKKMGIAFIPEKTWNVESSNREFCMKKVENLEMKRYVYLKWKKDSYFTDTMTECCKYIQEYFQRLNDAI